MRLVICDDNRIFGEAIAAALEAHGHQISAIATTAYDGIQKVAAHTPDACLLDLFFQSSPGGLTAARTIRKHHSRTKVLILSALTEPALVAQALKAGVVGFLCKDQGISQIVDALDMVAKGGLVIDAMPQWARNRAALTPFVQALGELSLRETEVLLRMTAGQDTPQMVREMQINKSTLQTYVKRVLAKLGVHSRLQAAALARKHGLVETPPAWLAASSAVPEASSAASG
jgi:two-component system nitrate/nitrite response regulator NarL